MPAYYKAFLSLFFILLMSIQGQTQSTAEIETGEFELMDSFQLDFECRRLEIKQNMEKADISYMISKNEHSGFGYFVFINGHLVLDQPVIPAIPGNHGFVSIQQAEKIAVLAIDKIKQGFIPPTIQIEELKERHIIFDHTY